MTFTPPVTQVPTTIKAVKVTLLDQLDEFDESDQSARYQITLLDQNGDRIQFSGESGNLVPHLTPAQISGLMGFMDDLRTQAETQIL